MTKLTFNRRRFLGTAAISGAVLASPVYLRSARAAGGEVNIWTYSDFVPKAFKEQFEAETGIKVNVRLVDDQGKQFNLLAAEAPNPTVDIMTIAGHRFLQFIDNDLLAPLDTGRLNNWGNINPTFSESDWSTINGHKWGAPILSGMEVLSYNTELVSAEAAKSWDVLFSEKYSGRTAYIIQDMMSIVMLKLGYDGNMVEYRDDPVKAAALAGEPLGRAHPGIVRDVTGFAIGGVSPVGHLNKIRAFFDPRLNDFGIIYAAAGTPRHIFAIEPSALQEISASQSFDFIYELK